MTSPESAGPDFVQSLARGLSVIKAFDADNPKLRLSEVANITGLTRAAARRFLRTLEELGYIRSDGKEFALRPRVLELGHAYLSSLSLPDVTMPHLEQLSARAHESASVAVLDGDEIVYIARVPTKRIMTVSIAIGTRFPAYATSLGKVLLAGQGAEWLQGYLAGAKLRPLTPYTIVDPDELRAELDEVGRQGWALADQQLEEGLRSLAVPIHDPWGKPIAGLNVSAHISRGSGTRLHDELLPLLRATAADIETDLRELGHHAPDHTP